MSIVQPRSDLPIYPVNNPTNKFARVDNNPAVRNAQYYAPYVYGSQGYQHPEFYKSPMTSVEMYRKNKARSIPINQGQSHIVQQPYTKNSSFCQGCDWKKILMWLLIGLALLALAIGLFCLIKYLMNKKDDGTNLRAYTPDISPATPTYTGINPIYVSPIPYSNMQVPTVSGYMSSPSSSDNYNYVTSPTASQTKQTSVTSVNLDSALTKQTSPVTQPTVRWLPDSTDSYVNPLDVYKLYHR